MPRRIGLSKLNASTMDILNTIRANATYEYQSLVPEVTKEADIPAVGQVLYGYPAMANLFINSLINRIALVRVKSATFNNAYAELKKGYLEFGETVEEVFVNICKAREFSVEKAAEREFKRTLPDVRTAFHAMNWRVQYPVTIQDEDLRTAFLSVDGVQDLIAKIVDSVYTAAEYDEYLLFKYLMIKAIAHGKMYAQGIGTADMKDAAIAFRGMSNKLTFMETRYNTAGVHTTTPKRDQYIFMDSTYNAQYDVNVLSAAFNMDKAEYTGKLRLIDSWNTFDNARFTEIAANSGMIEEVTAAELALMVDVKAVLVDSEWFQVYDNNIKFTDVRVNSGMYWNYFLNVWKTVSSSPFSNAVVFVADGANIAMPETITATVDTVLLGEASNVITLGLPTTAGFVAKEAVFAQTQTATEGFVAVHPYGAIIYNGESTATAIVLDFEVNNTVYRSAATDLTALTTASTIVFTKVV